VSSAGAGTSAPDIPVFDLLMAEEDLEAVAETLRSGWWTMGPRVSEFEREFAAGAGCAAAVATSSCTTALHLALLAAGVGPGDEVVLPAFTFVATAAAVMYAGATPVFADIVSLADPSLDPAEVEALIGERTKAVIAVHYAGYAAPVDRLAAICEQRGLALIEDCAHAPSATLGGRRLGSFGLAGAFSFFSNKVLAIGEGGALLSDDEGAAAQARLQRSQAMTAGTAERHTGRASGYDVTALGFNYRMDDPRAALLLSRMRRLDDEIERRRELTRAYRERLRDIDGVALTYADEQVAESSCYMLAVMLAEADRRDDVRLALRERGVQTTVMYPGIHRFSAYRERFGGVELPRTELAAASQLTLPLFPHLTDGQLDRVVTSLSEVLA